MEVKLVLTDAEVKYIGEVLAEKPFNQVAPLLDKIGQQAMPQMQAPEVKQDE